MGKYSYYLTSIFELLTGFENWPEVVEVFLAKDGKSAAEPAQPNRVIRLRKRGLQFKVRGKMDIWSVKEALIDRFYAPEGFDPQDGWTIVDIGAGIGEFTLEAAAGKPHSRVFAYEPFPGSFRLLNDNLQLNEIHNVQTFQKAIWSETGQLLLDLSSSEPLQLTSRQSGETVARIPGIILVESLSLADVLFTNGLKHIDLLKLDCEGAEFNILLGAAPDTLECIHRIVLEYHDAVGPHHHHELTNFLVDQGYRVRMEANQVHPDLGYLFAQRS